MAEGHTTLFTREWWITVFLVGLVIHLLASYLKPRLDQAGGWFSRSWATRNKRHAHERQLRIDRLRSDETARWVARQEEIRYHLRALKALAFTILMVVFLFYFEYLRHISTPFPVHAKILYVLMVFIAFITPFESINYTARAANLEAELREALEKGDETKNPNAENDDPETILPRQF
ncbi:MAG: hypothetical protein ACYDDS_19060 [Candidatus Sulfotelmatobacter sp.]